MRLKFLPLVLLVTLGRLLSAASLLVPWIAARRRERSELLSRLCGGMPVLPRR